MSDVGRSKDSSGTLPAPVVRESKTRPTRYVTEDGEEISDLGVWTDEIILFAGLRDSLDPSSSGYEVQKAHYNEFISVLLPDQSLNDTPNELDGQATSTTAEKLTIRLPEPQPELSPTPEELGEVETINSPVKRPPGPGLFINYGEDDDSVLDGLYDTNGPESVHADEVALGHDEETDDEGGLKFDECKLRVDQSPVCDLFDGADMPLVISSFPVYDLCLN
ncbi:hypothetical protein BDV95DRAFT_600602 [Massariosphaeria phaeospora]|uniref:Uncharacterized protein n=1 Tax=Massariosphaeria phaeospora TaxID=100035 RepID=A0A7C8IQW5_9PLEO|nr:hypothetical protein BDV95DRAFT_600602 [Massariosphaeria phaeospora]